MELLNRLQRHAREAPDRVAYREVTAGGRAMTYSQLVAGSRAFAAHLRRRLPGGTGVVMLCLPNALEYPVAYLGTLAAGLSVLPVSADSAAAELKSLASESGAAAIVGTDRACATLADVVSVAIPSADVLAQSGTNDVEANHAAGDLLLCSSGTTGRPKIVVRDAASVDAVSANMVDGVGFRPDDRALAIVPLCHSYGVEHGLLAPVWAGSTVHLCAGLDLAVVMTQLAGGGVTLFPGVPSAYDMICQVAAAQPLPALRKAYAAGAALPPAVYDTFQQKFGVRIGQLYGATEIGSVAFADPDAHHFDPRAVGRPFAGVRVRIVDPQTRADLPPGSEGEVLISAPSMLTGYLHETTPATIDGAFPTGDLGRIDGHGNLTITGRLKLLIEVGGLKVNVLEVEDLLARHPTVGEAAVVAMKVSETVSRLKAVVTPRNTDRPPSPDELRRFLRERLTAYKVPRVIEVRPALPRSNTGKVLRRLLEAP